MALARIARSCCIVIAAAFPRFVAGWAEAVVAVRVSPATAAPSSLAPNRAVGRGLMATSPIPGAAGAAVGLYLSLELAKVKRGYVRRLMTTSPEWCIIRGRLPQV